MLLLRSLVAPVLLVVTAAAPMSAAEHPWQIKSADGKTALVFGFLGQGQAEWVRDKSGSGSSQDLFLRRFRLIASGQVTEKLTFFIETDSPNLGKGTASGTKADEKIFFQDIIVTYSFRPQIQIDAGMLLVATSHNSGQGATTLMPIDYGAFSFLSSEPTGSRYGRDYGAQARGYLHKQHFEYRLGVFQGHREPNSTNPFRYAGRVVWYPFEAETGFFYTGTTLGTRRILAVGAGFDHQMDYDSQSVDVFLDQPMRGGDGWTLQAAYTHLDGGTTFSQLPPEHVWMVEAGYYNKRTTLGPFVQFTGRDFKDPQKTDASKYLGGLAYWASGHKLNLKLGVAHNNGGARPDSWQIVLQGQVYIY
jgi:hypothetical protein